MGNCCAKRRRDRSSPYVMYDDVLILVFNELDVKHLLPLRRVSQQFDECIVESLKSFKYQDFSLSELDLNQRINDLMWFASVCPRVETLCLEDSYLNESIIVCLNRHFKQLKSWLRDDFSYSPFVFWLIFYSIKYPSINIAILFLAETHPVHHSYTDVIAIEFQWHDLHPILFCLLLGKITQLSKRVVTHCVQDSFLNCCVFLFDFFIAKYKLYLSLAVTMITSLKSKVGLKTQPMGTRPNWPRSLLPQPHRLPFSKRTKVWNAPHVIDLIFEISGI